METPSLELVTELSQVARNAVSHLLSCLQSVAPSLVLEALDDMESSICAMVVSVRDLLYVSLIPPYSQSSVDEISPQPAIVPILRKVTVAITKLVHSARDIQYDSESSLSNSMAIVQEESEELLREMDAYVLEMRNQRERLAEQLRREGAETLDDFFPPRPCLAGAGAAGSWKGFGWVPPEESEEGPGLFLTGETITELDIHLTKVEDRLYKFVLLMNNIPGKASILYTFTWLTS
jgi:son of sevenless-like protein